MKYAYLPVLVLYAAASFPAFSDECKSMIADGSASVFMRENGKSTGVDLHSVCRVVSVVYCDETREVMLTCHKDFESKGRRVEWSDVKM